METRRIASRLRDIADHLERDAAEEQFPSEKEMKERFIKNLKKNFIESFRRDPANKGRDAEKVWEALRKSIQFGDIKRIFAT